MQAMTSKNERTTTLFVVQCYGATYYDDEVMWRDMYEHMNHRHENAAMRYMKKLNRGAIHNKTGKKYRVIKRVIHTTIVTNDEVFMTEE